MSIFWTVILTLLMFAVVIFVHESGHLICAKACHIYVEEFSVGMGPLLGSFQKGETKYSLRALPIGGYCKMPGEDGESDHPNGFDKKNVPRRMLVVDGGALFNLIFAMVLFVVAFMIMGTPSEETVIGEVSQGYPAAEAGLLDGDRITAINGEEVSVWSDMTSLIRESDGTLTLSVDRDGTMMEVEVTPTVSEDGTKVIGIVSSRANVSPFTAVKMGFLETYEITKLILVSLWQMITGAIGVDLAGPVGVGQMVGQAVSYGFLNFLVFIAVINVNLGIINLLPLPALDGSRLVFLMIEGIRRKPISRGVEGMIHFVGFALLMLLMVVITYFDIARIMG